jgi:hypothetical protein
MSNQDLVLDALAQLLADDPNRSFKRSELRAASGLSEGSFTPIFQHMSAGPGAPVYAQRHHGILSEASDAGLGWRRLTPKGKALLGLDQFEPGAPDRLPLVDIATMELVLTQLRGSRFDTLDFARRFAKDRPSEYAAIVDTYGPGGRGAGRHYSALSHIARSLSRYARAATADHATALHFDGYVPAPPTFGNPEIAMWISGAPEATCQLEDDVGGDIEAINNRTDLGPTSKKRMIESRLRQGEFRQGVVHQWNGRCALTGCSDLRVLVASHIKRWIDSDEAERVDRFNGLLLTPNADRLFDRHLITFDDSGRLVKSDRLPIEVLTALGIDPSAGIKIFAQHLPYLHWHRARFAH